MAATSAFVGVLDARTDVADDAVPGQFDPDTVLAGLLREMGFPVEAGARMSVAEAVDTRTLQPAMRSPSSTTRQIALVVENYVAAERFTATADYGRYDGDVFFVDATEPGDGPGRCRVAGLAAHVGGELRVVALDCRHSELMDSETLERLGPLIAAELAR